MQDKPEIKPDTRASSNKPITGAFQLQTKIRVIVQDVMAATIRKVSNFHEKIQSFDTFFFTYKQRIQQMQQRSKDNQEQNNKIFQIIAGNKRVAEDESLRLEQIIQKIKIQNNEQDVSIKDVNKKLATCTRQSQTLGSELSKTKAKFLQVSDQIAALKEDVAWKITKYIQETAEVNTKVKITAEEIKKQYFNVCLLLEKNKEKYQEIISHQDYQQNFNKQIQQDVTKLEILIEMQTSKVKSFNMKLQEMDTALYGKIKLTQSKLERRIQELQHNNKIIMKSVSKLQSFEKLLEQIRDDGQKIRRQLLKKFEESDQKHKDLMEQKILQINKGILAYQKSIDKKIKHTNEQLVKSNDFLTQKIQYLKIQIETEISTKTVKMMEKEKSQTGISNSMVQQLTQRINKLSMDTTKNMNKFQGLMKEIKNDVRTKIEESQQKLEEQVSNSMKIVESSIKGGIDPEILKDIHKKMQIMKEHVETKLIEMSKQLTDQQQKVKQVGKMKQQTQKQFYSLTQKNIANFKQLQQKLGGKVQKVMFTITKIRGDAIIKNEFIEKQIKQLKKLTHKEAQQIESINKLVPAIGQCINLMMCLIFDAEHQHARIIQDNLGGETNQIKFQNLLEGVLYEYVDKKKPGNIYYRHKQYKKTDIVKSTFDAFTQIWQDLFQHEYQDKMHMIPRSFHKNYIQKNVGRASRTGNSPRKQAKNRSIDNKQYISNKQLINARNNIEAGSQSRHSLGVRNQNNQPIQNSATHNRSFHIRKKKNHLVKANDQMVMVVSEQLPQ